MDQSSSYGMLNAVGRPNALSAIRHSTPKTLHDLAYLVEARCDLPPRRRMAVISAIRACAKAAASADASRRGGAITLIADPEIALRSGFCDVSWLNERMFKLPPKALGLSKSSFINYVSDLRHALLHAGVNTVGDVGELASDGVWGELLDQLKGAAQWRLGLGRFALYCERRGIAPEQVVDSTLAAFDVFVRHNVLGESTSSLAKSAAAAWRRARRVLPTWPAVAPQLAPRRQPYTLQFSAYPASLQAEIAAFEMRQSSEGKVELFTSDNAGPELEQSTVKARMFSLRQALAALVRTGTPFGEIRTLRDVVRLPAVERILTHFWEHTIQLRVSRGELTKGAAHKRTDGVSSQTGAIASVLGTIARYVICLPEPELGQVLSRCRDLHPKRSGQPSARNRARMRQFDDPAVLRAFLRLPGELMKEARALLADYPTRAARVARSACALQLLFHIPIRVENLCHLQFGTNLRTGDPRTGRISRLQLSVDETKNDADYEAAVEPGLADIMDEWRKVFRPILAPPGSAYLFPSFPDRAGPLTIDAMRTALSTIIADRIGVEFTPHFARHLCARIILDANPGAIEDVRQMLGDITLGVVLGHYAIKSQEQVGRRYDSALRKVLAAPPEPKVKSKSKPQLKSRRRSKAA